MCEVRKASFMQLGIYCAMPCPKHLESLLSFNSLYHLASLGAQMVRNTPAMWETFATTGSQRAWQATVHGHDWATRQSTPPSKEHCSGEEE